MFFSSWESIGRILLVGGLAYIGLVLLLRISGKRTLSKLNAFDLVVTVALGSTLATILLSSDVPLADGLTAFALLIFAQYGITSISTRSPRFREFITSQPRLLVYRGRVLHDALRAERLTEAEIRAVVRGQGIGDLEQVAAVILESDASLHVIPDTRGALDSLRDVRGAPQRDHPQASAPES